MLSFEVGKKWEGRDKVKQGEVWRRKEETCPGFLSGRHSHEDPDGLKGWTLSENDDPWAINSKAGDGTVWLRRVMM